MNDDWMGESAIRNVPRSRQLSPAGRKKIQEGHAKSVRCATPGCPALLPTISYHTGRRPRYCRACLNQMHKEQEP